MNNLFIRNGDGKYDLLICLIKRHNVVHNNNNNVGTY